MVEKLSMLFFKKYIFWAALIMIDNIINPFNHAFPPRQALNYYQI